MTFLLALVLAFAEGEGPTPFARDVDLAPIGRMAVHTQGRLKSFDSFASSMVQFVSGPRSYRDQTPAFTYLDMMLRPEAYLDADIIYVKNKPMRAQVIEALRTTPAAMEPGFEARMTRFQDKGLISQRLILSDPVRALLARLSTDLIKTTKFVDMLDNALAVQDPGLLLDNLRIVPPPEGNFETPWLGVDLVLGGAPTALTEAQSEAVRDAFTDLVDGWRAQDAPRVSAAGAALADVLPTINPELYPVADRLEWESWYFRKGNMTWIWVFYLLAIVPLLLAVIYGWKTARRIGLALFLVAFALQTFAVGLRWYVSQRWPNSNMFEAVTTAAWFGGCAALILEWIVRKRPMRNLFALGSAAASMIALMAVHFLPVALTPQIGNMMPVLHDLWLYIHTNVIIFSYCPDLRWPR